MGVTRPTSASRTRRGCACREGRVGAGGPQGRGAHGGGFFLPRTGLDIGVDPEPTDRLVVPQQKLLELTAGRVYHDGLGELGKARAKLAYYPRDAWLYLLAAQWRRVGATEEESRVMGTPGEPQDQGCYAPVPSPWPFSPYVLE